jgi:Uma2 family endonuclease
MVTVPTAPDTVSRGSCAPRRRTWTADEYHRAATGGLFHPDEKMELIWGEVVRKASPQGSKHFAALRRATEALETPFGDRDEVRPQGPLTISDESEPEPDVLVAAGTSDRYERRHPGPTETLLVVEVSDTTLAFERGEKASLYASFGIRKYWIVNLPAQQIEVYREPGQLTDAPHGFAYKTTIIRTRGESISLLAAPDATISVSDLLPTTETQ